MAKPWERKWGQAAASKPWERTWGTPAPTAAPQPSAGPTSMEAFMRTGSPLPDDPEITPEGMFQKQAMPEPKPAPYNFTIGGQELSPETQEYLRPATDAVVGMNNWIARTIGVGIEDANLIWQDLGNKGFLDRPDLTVADVTKSMEGLGFAPEKSRAVSQLAADIGEDLFKSLGILAIGMGMAPAAATLAPTTTTRGVVQQTGEMLMKNPGTAIASETGATIGGNVGQEYGGTPGGMIGSLLGGGAGASTAIPRIAQGLGAVTGGTAGVVLGTATPLGPLGGFSGMVTGGYTGGRIAKRMTQRFLARRDMPKTSIMTGDDPVLAQQYAQQAIVADKALVQKEIDLAINKIGGNPNVTVTAEKFHDTVKQGYKKAQGRADQMWGKVNKTKTLDPARLQHFTKTIVQDAGQFGTRDVPGEIIADIAKLKPGKATIGDVLAIRNKILGDLSEGVDRDGLRRNYNRLQSALLNSIGKQYPGDRDLAAAREYSLWLHDHFSRGPLGSFYGRSKANASYLDDPAARGLLFARREKGGKQVAEATARLNMPQLESQAAGLVRSQFQSLAQEMGPEAGSRWLNSPSTQRFMKSFPKPYAQMQDNLDQLDGALKRSSDIGKSSFLKFADEDIQTATQKLFSGGQKTQRAGELKRRLSEDPDGQALPALKNSMIKEFQRMSGNNPSTMKALLAGKDTRETFATIFNPDEMKRFDRIVDAADALQTGGLKKFGGQVSTYFSRMLGARTISSMSRGRGGGPSIQETGGGARIGEMIFRTLMGKVSPEELLARAIVDPKAERLLFSRIPSNIRDIQRDAQIIRDLIASTDAASRGE